MHFPIDSLSHSLSHLNIISSFIIYYFFNNYTSFNIFFSTPNYYDRKKGFEEWTVAPQTWWATVHEKKKKPVLEKLLEHSFPLFSNFTLYILAMHALYFSYACSVGDALKDTK